MVFIWQTRVIPIILAKYGDSPRFGWMILPEFWRSFPLYFDVSFVCWVMILPALRCYFPSQGTWRFNSKTFPRTRTSTQGLGLERTRFGEWFEMQELQMGCLSMPNSWGIYRVKTLELKGCLQCQHSILNQMCGELVSVTRRTFFVRRTKKLSSPTFSLILPF